MTFIKGMSWSESVGRGGMPTFRIAVPAWRQMTPAPMTHNRLVSRDEILALFGDRLKPVAVDRLTLAEHAQKLDIARLRQAIYS